jgi:phage major head subunit gpT-like protein
MAAAANGYAARAGESVNDGNLREVLEYAFPPRRIAAASTLNVANILTNVANKELLSGYTEENEEWRQIAAIKSVNDFKQATSYRLLDNMEYEEIGADGQIKHGSLSEESYTRQAKTYAKMFSLTRTDIINDDLGAFDDIRTRLGRGAKKKFNNIFWATFMNNSAFFTSGRGNYITGATTNLLVDGVGLEQGVTAFRKLKSPAADGSKKVGNTVGGRPDRLLVPPELEFTADRLYASAFVTGGSSPTPDANIHANKYRPIVVDWLSDSAFTGFSATAWYLMRNPADMAAVVVSFLNGQQSPTVESAEADFNTLGVQMRGYHDWGCDQAEYLSGIKSKGAA